MSRNRTFRNRLRNAVLDRGGKGALLGHRAFCWVIGAYALVYSEMSGGIRSLKQSLSEERDLNVLQKERAHLRRWNRHMDALLEERSPFP